MKKSVEIVAVVLLLALGVGVFFKAYETRRQRSSLDEALSLYAKGEDRQALQELEKILHRWPKFRDGLISQLAILGINEDDAFDKKLEQFAAVFPKDEATSAFRAWQRGAALESANELERVLGTLNGIHVEIREAIAWEFDEADDLPRATQWAQTCTSQSVGCRYLDGFLQIEQDHYDSALKACDSPDAWLVGPCAVALAGKGNVDEALQRLQGSSSATATPERYRRSTVRALLPDLLVLKGKVGDARKALDFAASTSTGITDSQERQLEAAEAAMFAGDFASAINLASTIDANTSDPASKNMAHLLQSEAMAASGKVYREDEELEGSIRGFVLGEQLLAIRQYENAVRQFEIAAEHSRDPRTLFYLAESYRGAGRPQEARDVLEKVIAHKGTSLVQSESFYWVAAHERLAEVDFETLRREAAKSELDDFFSIWKSADPNLPLMQQAVWLRKRIASTRT